MSGKKKSNPAKPRAAAPKATVKPSKVPRSKPKSKNSFAVSYAENKQLVPHNEQDRRQIDRVMTNKVNLYAASLLCPKRFMSRIPDAFARETALYRGIRVFDVQVVFPATPNANQGKFSFAFQPKLGNFGSPIQYQTGYSSPTLMAQLTPVDWSLGSSYLSAVSNNDPRVDDNIEVLTQENLGLYDASATTGVSTTVPFGTGAPVIAPASYGLQVFYDQVTGDFTLPVGNYVITINQGYAVIGAVTPTQGAGFAVWTSTSGPVVSASQTMQTWLVTVSSGNSVVTWTTTGTPNSADITIAPTVRGDLSLNTDSGIVKSIRSVAQTALFTYTGTFLQNGGNVACAYVPSGSLSSNYYTSAPSEPGDYHDWEMVARIPGSYNGAIKDGAFTWWAPEGNQNTEFNAVSAHNNMLMPALIISGIFSPGTITPGTYTIGRIELISVFEYTTTSTFPSVQRWIGTQAMVDEAQAWVSESPHCMANEDHVSWYDRILSWLQKAVPIAKDIATIATWFL
jgi:hypothetical protein